MIFLENENIIKFIDSPEDKFSHHNVTTKISCYFITNYVHPV